MCSAFLRAMAAMLVLATPAWPRELRVCADPNNLPFSNQQQEGFENAIRERESRGEKAETRFVSIDRSDIIGADLRGQTAQITMRFVSQLVSVTRDGAGAIVDGNSEKATEVTDVWPGPRGSA